MLTPDQIRLRLERIRTTLDHESACYSLLQLLEEVLPDLVAFAQTAQRPESQASERLHWCTDCTPEQPCERARSLIGE